MTYSSEEIHEIQELLEYFHHKCVRCSAPAVTIHEIIPRSMGKVSQDRKNKVALCANCHFIVHEFGTGYYREELTRLREEFVNENYPEH